MNPTKVWARSFRTYETVDWGIPPGLSAIIGHNLVDLGRTLDPANDQLYTWWPPWRNMRQRNIGWRIDYVLASAAVAARATSCPSFREVGTSDHAPVVAAFGD